ncbi:uroporphyrin-III methyltransferase [Neisseria arctica]|uniref:Uroporphyrin-III methyltransferase n=1 Tax=Neisseria arctica TaxID=1470200 RepID=A0A0J1C2V1_9NEIS|nr:uroporphyrin-III methyltransferase [Neisseria arctica]
MSKPEDAPSENPQVETKPAVEQPEHDAVKESAVSSTEADSGKQPATDSPSVVQAAGQKAEKISEKNESVGKPMSETNQNPAPATAPVVIKQSSGKGLAVGALVLALLGLGASGFLFVQGQNLLKTQQLSFDQKIDKAALGESQNANLLQDNLRKQAEVESLLAQLSTGQKANAEQIAAANRAYQELLKGRANWLVDEVEATLNLASQQLLLSGNVPVAVTVLESIESRLSRFDQPDLLPIKQAISSDLAGLKNRPYLDISATSLRLDRLETAVAGLPLVLDNTLQPGKAEPLPEDDANLPWWQNAWNKILASLKGVVEVRHLNNNDAMLIAPEQVYFVRENLRLHLLDARTALLRHNGEVYQSDLNSAEAAVKQYFDPASPATQSWLKELAELKAIDVRMISDNALKASLTAVRAYQDSVRTAMPVASASDTVENNAASEASAPAQASSPETSPKQPEKQEAAPAAPAEAPASQVKGDKV